VNVQAKKPRITRVVVRGFDSAATSWAATTDPADDGDDLQGRHRME